ncbi:MAG: 50S ribosomal protein L24 [Metamycoplasmataceae bacterium]
MKIRKNDEVVIIAGKEKGKTGFVIKVDKKNDKVLVKDINMITKHIKPSQQKTEGSVEKKESFLHISNVAIKSKTSKKGANDSVRVGYRYDKDKKIRFDKKTGKDI